MTTEDAMYSSNISVFLFLFLAYMFFSEQYIGCQIKHPLQYASNLEAFSTDNQCIYLLVQFIIISNKPTRPCIKVCGAQGWTPWFSAEDRLLSCIIMVESSHLV